MTLEAMTKAGDMMRSVCQPKFKIADGMFHTCTEKLFIIFVCLKK